MKKGEKVGVIISNSVEWFILENATHGLGGAFVPMYEKELEKTWTYIIKDSGIRFLFVRNEAIFEKTKKFKSEISTLEEIFTIYGSGPGSMAELEKIGQENPVESYKPHWTEMAEIIYTSGTTGDPKGVMLSHGNLSACSQSGYLIYPDLDENSISLAILPWAHSYGLSAELHNFLQFGGAMGLMESVDTLAADLLAVRPTFLIAVPRVFNKIYNGIQAAMDEAGGLKKKLFDAACREAARQRNTEKKSLKLRILDKVVFSKIRAKFGGRIRGVMTASAVMNPDIAWFFKDIGLPTFDCYGLSETSPAITMNSPLKGNKYGTVGQPVKNMHVVIDKSRTGEDSPDGEILAYGAHVMMGYLNKPEQTAAIMLNDTWNGFPGIRTGDLGRIDSDGYLSVTGRFKDEYKLTNGKYVHPESIETSIKLLPYFLNAFIYGDGKEYNVCLVVPDYASLQAFKETAEIAKGTPAEMANNRELNDFLTKVITEHLKKSFTAYEIPKKFIFTSEDFTVENGMLTQTMKVKRREILNTFGAQIEKLYSEK